MKFATLALIGAATASEATDIVKGVIMGAANVEIDGKCIQDVETVVKDAQTVVADFEKKTFASVIDGVKEIVQTVGDVKTGIADCTGKDSIVAKLEALEAVMASPTSFAYHVGKDLKINGKDIFSEVTQAVADYKKQDFYNFGVQVGEAAAKTLIGQESRVEGAELIMGFANAYGGHFNLEALLACIGEEDKAALILNAVIPALEDGIKTKNPQEIIEGAIGIFAAYQQAMKGLPACEAVDRSTFGAMNKDLMSSMTELNVLELDGESVSELIMDIVGDYEKKDMAKLGHDLAALLKKLISKQAEPYYVAPAKEEKISRKDITSLVQGYFEATKVGTFNFTMLLECIYAADQAAEVADMDYHLIKQAIEDRSVQEAIPAVIGAVALVQAAKQALPVCENVDMSNADWTTYDQIIETIEAPTKFMKVVEHEIVANGVEVTKEVGNTIAAIRSGDFYAAGIELGTFMANTCEVPSLFLF